MDFPQQFNNNEANSFMNQSEGITCGGIKSKKSKKKKGASKANKKDEAYFRYVFEKRCKWHVARYIRIVKQSKSWKIRTEIWGFLWHALADSI